MTKLKVYLDNCCYNRPFDDLAQARIKREAEAVKLVLSLSKQGVLLIVASIFTDIEMNQTKNDWKYRKVLELYRYDEYYRQNENIENTAKRFQTYGLKPFDSLHLAVAETNHVDYLLTTDDGFIATTRQFEHITKIMNPYNFINEEKYR